MKKLLTIVIFCSILFLGCGKVPPIPDGEATIPPMPVLDPDNSIVKVYEAIPFVCIGSTEIAGKMMRFSHTNVKTMEIGRYSIWLFNSNDSIFTEYGKDLFPGRTWVDLGNDKKPEHFANSPKELKNYPDICKTLDYFRELNGREPRKRELGKTQI